jgi:hypothetical protein
MHAEKFLQKKSKTKKNFHQLPFSIVYLCRDKIIIKWVMLNGSNEE